MSPEEWAIRSAIAECRRFDIDPGVHPDRFLDCLEYEGFTVMPVGFRRNADLWGTATITRLRDGSYALVDPSVVRIEVPHG